MFALETIGIASGNPYNANKIRLPTPVPVDSKVRGRAEVVSIDEKGGGWYEVVTCFAGDSVTRVMAPTDWRLALRAFSYFGPDRRQHTERRAGPGPPPAP